MCDMDVPQMAGDVIVRRIQTQGDHFFQDGFGLEMMRGISLSTLQTLLSTPRQCAVVQEAVDCYGALRIRCPDLRSMGAYRRETVESVKDRNKLLMLHKDGDDSFKKDVLMMGDRENWPVGSTIVATNRSALRVILDTRHIPTQGFWQPFPHQIEDCLTHNNEYGPFQIIPQAFTNARQNFNRANSAGQQAFMCEVAAYPEGVIVSKWGPEEPEALLASSRRTVHGRPSGGGGVIHARYVEKSDALQQRHVNRMHVPCEERDAA